MRPASLRAWWLAAVMLAGLAALLASAAAAAADPALPQGFQDSEVIKGLEQPTAVRFAPNGMVFVAEKAGRILVYENLEDETPELFKDLRTEVYNHADRGLLGLAIDPAFPTKPYVYALFTYDHVLGSSEPVPEWGEPNQTGDECSSRRQARRRRLPRQRPAGPLHGRSHRKRRQSARGCRRRKGR